MSASRFARSADLEYFRALETLFIELRGAPLQLSPDDFRVAKTWRAEGVPLDVACDTVREVVERAVAAEKEVKKRLRYYDRAVRSAWKRQGELAAPGAMPDEPALDLPARLDRLAAALPVDTFPALEPLAAAIRALPESPDAGPLDAEAIEERLAALDRQLVATALESLTESDRRDLEDSVDHAVDGLRTRLGDAEADAARPRLTEQILRRRVTIPVLSLFSPEAIGQDSVI